MEGSSSRIRGARLPDTNRCAGSGIPALRSALASSKQTSAPMLCPNRANGASVANGSVASSSTSAVTTAPMSVSGSSVRRVSLAGRRTAHTSTAGGSAEGNAR
jgi:hypothetical protein